MSYLLESLVQILTSWVGLIIRWTCQPFVQNFQININTYSEDGEALGYFEKFFPVISAFPTIFMFVAYFFLFFVFTTELLKNFLGPVTEPEDPVHLIIRLIAFGLVIGLAYPTLNVVQGVMNEIYNIFLAVDVKGYDSAGTLVEPLLELDISQLASPPDAANPIAVNAPSEDVASIVTTLLGLICLVAILVEFLRLMLEIAERYCILALLYYTFPLACAAGVSKSTSNILNSFLRMLISQYILMFLNVFFLKLVISAFITLRGLHFTSMSELLVWMFVIISLLKVGQRVDAYMASLGMSTAQAGGGIWSAVIAAAGTIMALSRAGKMASGAVRGTRNTINSIGDFFRNRNAFSDNVASGGGSAWTPEFRSGNSGQLTPNSYANSFRPGDGATAKYMDNPGTDDVNVKGTGIDAAAMALNANKNFGASFETDDFKRGACMHVAGQGTHLELNDGTSIDIAPVEKLDAAGVPYAMFDETNGLGIHAEGDSAGKVYAGSAFKKFKDEQASTGANVEDAKAAGQTYSGLWSVIDPSSNPSYVAVPQMYDLGPCSVPFTKDGADFSKIDFSEPVYGTVPTAATMPADRIALFKTSFPNVNEINGDAITDVTYNQSSNEWTLKAGAETYNMYSPKYHYTSSDTPGVNVVQNDRAQPHFIVNSADRAHVHPITSMKQVFDKCKAARSK